MMEFIAMNMVKTGTKTVHGVTDARRFAMQMLMGLVAAAGVIGFYGTAHAAGKAGKGMPDNSHYQSERAACMNGASNQDRTTCLREAAAAREETRRGHLTDDPGAQQKNVVARCQKLPQADQSDCIRRAQGEGMVSGSPEAGGVFRETITTVPAASPVVAPMPETAPAPTPAPRY
jgi:hypothetical protein